MDVDLDQHAHMSMLNAFQAGSQPCTIPQILPVPCDTWRRAAAMHGDLDQHTRVSVLNAYKAGTHHVLVATDVAARGLDIKSIKTVVNFDTAKNIETHVHRIGRTGRAGDKDGTAITLVAGHEARFAGMYLLSCPHWLQLSALQSLLWSPWQYWISRSQMHGVLCCRPGLA